MDIAFTHVFVWTILAFVLTWTVFYVTNRGKKATKLADAVVEERKDGAAADVIIVGAGVGGSALAYALAKDGRRVHIIERDMREPERMMGEFMQPGGRFMLSKLDLEDCLEGIDAQKATGMAVYKDGKEAVASFPVDNNNFPYDPSARSFHNGRFVQRLRQKASSLPNVRLEEGTVRSLIEEKGVIKGVTYKNSAGKETTAFAPLTVVCDGCYSNLRRSLNDNNAEVLSYQVGYISRNCQLEEPEKLKLIMSSVLWSVCNFWLAAYRLPNECIQDIEKMCSAFLWSGKDMNAHRAKISWENVCKPKQEGGLGLRSLKEANNVCCLKLIWRIVSQGNSLWVKWIQMYLLKKTSFWSINSSTNMGSWIWKKLLKYREVAKQFCKVEVGNGELTSFWYDDWSSMGRLVDIVGARGVIDMGISRTSSLAAAWSNRRRRRHRAATLNAMEDALQEQREKRKEQGDTVLWRGKNDIFKPKFSAKDTWNHIRITSSTVSWHRGVWFAHATPKFSFCVWLAAQNRLSTGDHMIKWQGGAGTCVLCHRCLETRNHLFFGCDFSSTIWAALAKGLLKTRYTTDWLLLLDIISSKQLNRVEGFLFRYVFQAVTYTIWRERNGRRHGENPQTAERITGWIDKHVRNQISAVRLMGDRRYDDAYQLWLQARS